VTSFLNLLPVLLSTLTTIVLHASLIEVIIYMMNNNQQRQRQSNSQDIANALNPYTHDDLFTWNPNLVTPPAARSSVPLYQYNNNHFPSATEDPFRPDDNTNDNARLPFDQSLSIPLSGNSGNELNSKVREAIGEIIPEIVRRVWKEMNEREGKRAAQLEASTNEREGRRAAQLEASTNEREGRRAVQLEASILGKISASVNEQLQQLPQLINRQLSDKLPPTMDRQQVQEIVTEL
jgi:hypothetical protein